MNQNHTIPHLLLAFCILLFIPTSNAQDGDFLKVSRYGLQSLSPKPDEADLLSVIIEIEFPRVIQKVGDALDFLLSNSGYRLDDIEETARYHHVLFNFDLPEAHRTLGPMTLFNVLSVLGGKGFQLEVNPVIRVLRYKVASEYVSYLSETDIEAARDAWLSWKERSGRFPADISAGHKNSHGGGTQYGPVAVGETLYRIAESLPVAETTIEQRMVALFNANQDAFLGNINMLLAGKILLIPHQSKMAAIDQTKAGKLISIHYQQWAGNRYE